MIKREKSDLECFLFGALNTNISRKQALRDELLILKLRQAELSMFDDEYASNRRKIRVLENEIYSCR